MEDLSANLTKLLSSPQGQEQLKQAAALLLGASGKASAPEKPEPQGPDPALLAQLPGIFSSLGQEDDSVRLLRALQPHLREENRGKVDNAIGIMQLLNALPRLREAGLV